jgi:glycosyltransferase involved in cell wall biosynthesis
MLKVVIDISVLGQGHHFAAARTGVFRYVENLVGALLHRDDVDLTYSAGTDLDDYFRCSAYLRSSPEPAADRLVPPALHPMVFLLFESTYRWLGRSEGSHPGVRAVRFLYRVAKKLVDKRRILNLASWAEGTLYHAVFAPPPIQLRNRPDVRVVQTVHDLIAIKFPEFCTAGSIDLVNRMVDSIRPDTRVVCVSNSTRNDLLAHKKLDPDHVKVTPLAASSKFHPCRDEALKAAVRTKLGIPPGDFILSLSTLEPRKNIVSVIRAYDELVTQFGYAELNLVLAGTKGWNYDDIFKQLLMHPQTTERVVVTGFVDEKDLAALYSSAAMFVYTSHYEGFGLPPLEAMQCGVPVVTSNVSSLPEVVGDAGILVDPNNSSGIATAMRSIHEDPDRAADLSRKGLERAGLFQWEHCAALTVHAYHNAYGDSL